MENGTRQDTRSAPATHGTASGNGPTCDAAAAWVARAGELAGWALVRLVNRRDVWGAYLPRHRRQKGNSVTAPARARRGAELLTAAVLARHFAGADVGHLVGLHSTSPDNTSLWAALDIDNHGAHSTPPAANLAAALAWFNRLRGLGFSPLLVDSNGAGGFHLWALFAGPVPTPRAYAFLRWLTADHARHGLAAPPEQFPKQPRIDPVRYGNWLRLAGRHHTRDHWARLWDGRRWLEGAAAVEHILSAAGAPASAIPAGLPEAPDRPRAVLTRPAPPPEALAAGGELGRRAAAYLARLPNLAEGQGRDDVAYHFAAFLARDLRLPDDVALHWLRLWDAGNMPPKGEARLREVLASAHRYGRNDYGAGLADRPPPARAFRVPSWTPRPAPRPCWVGGTTGKEARP